MRLVICSHYYNIGIPILSLYAEHKSNDLFLSASGYIAGTITTTNMGRQWDVICL